MNIESEANQARDPSAPTLKPLLVSLPPSLSRSVIPGWKNILKLAARISGLRRFLYIKAALCAPGTAAADVGNALREERGQILWDAGQYFAHIFSPSHRNVF